MKSDDATKSIPLYALTAHTLPHDRKKAIDAGCDGFVPKPIHMKNFVDVVEQALLVADVKKNSEIDSNE